MRGRMSGGGRDRVGGREREWEGGHVGEGGRRRGQVGGGVGGRWARGRVGGRGTAGRGREGAGGQEGGEGRCRGRGRKFYLGAELIKYIDPNEGEALRIEGVHLQTWGGGGGWRPMPPCSAAYAVDHRDPIRPQPRKHDSRVTQTAAYGDG